MPMKRCPVRAPARTPRIVLALMAVTTDPGNRLVVETRLMVAESHALAGKARFQPVEPPVVSV
jgi:hypothetical protein